jgi:hypothetical protein
MLAGGDGSRGCDHVVLDAEIVVAVLEVFLVRAAGDVGIDPLEAAVIERNHVVLDRLDEPEPLQFSEFLRVLGGEIGGLGPVVGTAQLPDIGVAGSSALTRAPCGRNSIAAVWVRLRTAALDAA